VEKRKEKDLRAIPTLIKDCLPLISTPRLSGGEKQSDVIAHRALFVDDGSICFALLFFLVSVY
jgi:hypothetical protein